MEHRFRISKDEFSRERYKTVKETVEELVNAFPDRGLAFTLFGSLTKGKVLRNSEEAFNADIDMLCYFRGDIKMTELEIKTAEKICPGYRIDNFDLFLSVCFARRLVKNQKCNFNGLNYASIKPVKLRIGVTKESVSQPTYNIGQFSDFDIFMLSGLDIGGHCQKYIRKFLKDFYKREYSNQNLLGKFKASLGYGFRKKWWQLLTDVRLTIERRGQEEWTKKLLSQFPSTFEEACKRYNVRI